MVFFVLVITHLTYDIYLKVPFINYSLNRVRTNNLYAHEYDFGIFLTWQHLLQLIILRLNFPLIN